MHSRPDRGARTPLGGSASGSHVQPRPRNGHGSTGGRRISGRRGTVGEQLLRQRGREPEHRLPGPGPRHSRQHEFVAHLHPVHGRGRRPDGGRAVRCGLRRRRQSGCAARPGPVDQPHGGERGIRGSLLRRQRQHEQPVDQLDHGQRQGHGRSLSHRSRLRRDDRLLQRLHLGLRSHETPIRRTHSTTSLPWTSSATPRKARRTSTGRRTGERSTSPSTAASPPSRSSPPASPTGTAGRRATGRTTWASASWIPRRAGERRSASPLSTCWPSTSSAGSWSRNRAPWRSSGRVSSGSPCCDDGARRADRPQLPENFERKN